MKKKKWLKSVFLLLLLCVSVLVVSENASAATKNGWVKKTYYYKNGKMVKNKWMKIKNKKYYFGKKGKVTKGIAVIKGKFYFFNKTNGVLNTTKTKKIQAAAKYEKNFAALKKLIGKPKKSQYFGGSCYGKGKDGVLTYSGFKVYTYKENGKEIFLDVE